MIQQQRAHASAAIVAALSLSLQPFVSTIAAAMTGQTTTKPAAATQAQAPAKPAATGAQPTASGAKPATASAATTAPLDGGWPRVYNLTGGGSILVYQPQISSWEAQKQMVAFSAVSYRTPGAEKPVLGTFRLESDTSVAVADRLVKLQKLKIAEANFQTLPKDQVREISAAFEKAIPDTEIVIGLDRILANLDKSQIIPKNKEGVKADPPTIFFSKTPAVLMNLDGEPIWSPIKENDLKYAVNTNWDLFQHGPTSTYYLRNETSWLQAKDVNGPWSAAGKLPDSFNKLPADENWKDVKAALPPKAAASPIPKVLVAMQPSELILLTGEPRYAQVSGTALFWVSNTESDVFRMGKTGLIYYLVAGRWFSAQDFAGPWTFATPSLPDDFKKIPLEHDRSRVLASVPGTDQAAEAVLLASIPQTARVNKKELKAPEVPYQGDPQFQPIEKTSVQRAVNTDKDVFKVGDLYYMCYQAVWFVGKTATGPWEVASSVPQQIYEIPVSSPAHHVTYVTVEDDDSDDDWVVYAAAAGYTGMMVAWGCTVWGSGWYYPPYWGYGGFYPYYYPHFPTYGYSAWYNPWTGAYGRSARVYGPYGGAGVGARYNPRTGTYARGAAAYGPYGARGVAQAYNPRTGTYAATRQGSNVYGSWGSTAVQRGDDWAKTNRYTNNRTGTTTRTIRTDEGNAVTRRGPDGGRVAAGSGGDVYAGKDGNVYRRDNGTWQKYDNGGWTNTDRQPSERPTPNREAPPDRSSVDRSTTDQLNRDSRARSEGTTRTRDYGNYRGGSGTRGTGSYRGGGGARAGGGRRR
ncbi:MAG TPA: hypothetical protein VFT39_20905 [Vicinamibacterales bacterium]|nr:hypothetical protein [Vicinamibacterales bacterium]